eukprot:570984-Rhodomonas_salina.1
MVVTVTVLRRCASFKLVRRRMQCVRPGRHIPGRVINAASTRVHWQHEPEAVTVVAGCWSDTTVSPYSRA